MTRLVLILVSLCSIGCARHQAIETLSTHPNNWWSTTGSPCVDAMQINTIAEGCTQMNTSLVNDVWLQFRCADDVEGDWSQSWWLFTPTGNEPLPGYEPVCVDESGMLSIRNQ